MRRWFDGRIAYEMRLWDALEQGLLAPFQYFGVKDTIDLGDVAWSRGWGYDRDELSRRYLADGADARVRLVLQELERRVVVPRRMRALGFCVSVEHARFMAESFTKHGLASVAVTGDTPGEERESAIRRLEDGALQALFTVDLFNEGIDIPRVDTVLFLRPTESATVFLQQLGRGLRLHREKPCLTVLDFIGNARREFRFDRRFRALLGGTTRQVERHIEHGFPYLPPGCAMQLDPEAQRVVLANIRANLGAGRRWLAGELSALGSAAGLETFLRETGVALTELYAQKRSFTSLQEAAFGMPRLDDEARGLHAGLRAILHVNDPERLAFLRALSDGMDPLPPVTPRGDRVAAMIAAALLDCRQPSQAYEQLAIARRTETFRRELAQLVDVLEDTRREVVSPWVDPKRLRPAPLYVHGRYRQEEILAALGVVREAGIPRLQGGVFFIEDENLDLLFVTLKKSAAGFTPTTMYRDYALSPTRFHWETQNAAHPASGAGRRYLEKTSTVLLFVREAQEQANGVAEPYWFLGAVTLDSAAGERPIQIVWRLATAMPGHLYQKATVAAG